MPHPLTRCEWSVSDPLYIQYHDEEWGAPLHDEQKLFEFLILEGMQAGLSWLTILKKRENFRKAFDNFNCQSRRALRRTQNRNAHARRGHHSQSAKNFGDD